MTTGFEERNAYTHPSSQRANAPTPEVAAAPGLAGNEALAEEPMPLDEATPIRRPQLAWHRNPAEPETTGPLYVHERMSGEDFVRPLMRDKPTQPMLNFLHNGLPEVAITEPYQHRGNWTNRLIRATAHRAMSSLLHKEGMAGEVDLIYLDPPYNISFKSQWQLTTHNMELPSQEEQAISSEPEVLRVFRDTYQNGVHGYLDGLHLQLKLARQLLRDSGSIIVQIGPDNLHQVAMLMAEVFGADNHVCTIPYVTSRMQAKFLGEVSNWLIWYGKDKEQVKYRQLYVKETLDHYLEWSHSGVQELQSGKRRPLTANEKKKVEPIPNGWEIYRGLGFSSSHTSFNGRSDTYFHHPNGPCQNAGWTKAERQAAAQSVEHPDHTCNLQECEAPLPDNWHEHQCSEACHQLNGNRRCPKGRKCGNTCHANAVPIPAGRQWRVSLAGLHAIAQQGKLYFEASAIAWQMLQSEHPGRTLPPIWNDAGIVPNKSYFVETPPRVLERCILMTTDPGDLVLDLTCGSGAMPVMAENWGRRWIGVDVSSVAIAIARERVALATYDNHVLADSPAGHRANHANQQTILPPEKRSLFQPNTAYRNDPAKGFVNDRQLRVSARTLAYGPKPDGFDVIVHPDRTLLDKSKVRVAGPFTVESDSPHRALTPEQYTAHDSAKSKNGFTNIQQHVLQRLTEVPITGNNTEYRLSNLQPAPEYSQITHTAEVVFENGERKPAILYVGDEDETVGTGRSMSAIRMLAQYPQMGNHVILVGFAVEPEAAAVRRLHPEFTVDTVIANRDLQLANLTNSENDRPFTIISEPDVRLKKHADGSISVQLTGIHTFDGTAVKTYGPDRWLSMMIDTNYDLIRFNCALLNVNTKVSTPGKSRLVRLLKAALRSSVDDDKFAQMQTNESLPFAVGDNGAIAVKVIDHVGTEHIRVIDNLNDPSLYE